MIRNSLIFGLVCIALLAANAAAATAHYWRFEDAPGFLQDSAGSATLTNSGSATQLALPGSGRASSFQPASNEAADMAFTDVLTASTSGAGDFTIELFAHADSTAGPFGNAMAGFALTASNIDIGWVFQMRASKFQLLAFDGISTKFINSGIDAVAGKDYYAAVAFDLTGNQATFYIQNLTDDGALQTAVIGHSMTGYNAINTFVIGGAADTSLGFDGVIDEVRLSDNVLNENQLLLNNLAVPEPSSFVLFAGFTVFLRHRSRQHSPRRARNP